MSWENVLGLLASCGLLGYLLWVLVFPERF
ncbi:potassium-transporting ATPase subunit F [Streptomyces carpaticus]|uniref:K+-transporting ATPase, KdpF subunit n=1 Tax=Streptomyces harbinensis TaxID=1176198 RepID=A0A1I6RIV7_9ACTN|nr:MULTISPECIES: potassium-transporting ATPase subunit F [Streptomyces]QKV68674.1 potassium-transporting ATPase subunit F [Streptomyces harbinensis]UWM49005.1 potassium-transporting ATPase subunit F [Streptomyces carpaticus]SFS64418.1 K+-transporting ATPase, KdpF subunit [Streptomyces harbinensis]